MTDAKRGIRKWAADIRLSVLEEMGAMMSGHFVPYHKLCFLAAIVTTVVLSFIFSQMGVIEAPVKVIDLDRSQRSAAFIEAIDASRDIRVTQIVRAPVAPDALIRSDNAVGVLYIPKGFEEAILTGKGGSSVGFFADQTNAAQNGEVFSAVSEIAAEEGIPLSAGNLQALGAPAAGEASGALTVKVRRLFNPSNSLAPTVCSFLYFFSGIYFAITTLMLTGRLHVSGLWEKSILERGPSAMIGRLIPYCLGYCAAVTVMTAALVFFNALPFKGNYLAYLPSLFMMPLSLGLLAMFLTWNQPTPANGAALMIFIVPPGFIMGGMTMAIHEFPGWAQLLSHAVPLTWQFGMLRDFAFRGKTAAEMAGPYGAYLLYLTALLALVTLRFYWERRKLERIRERSEAREAALESRA